MKNLIFLAYLVVFTMFTSIRGQWQILNEGGSFRTIDFVNDQVGWIAGENTLLKTEDGGQTWISVSMDSSWEFDKIDFVNENVGWAITIGNGRPIIKTMDGGKNWSKQINFEIPWYPTFDLKAVTDSIVYVFNRKENAEPGNIYRTSDGGNNWIDVSPKLENRRIESIWFYNKDLGVASGSDNDRGIILKTKDGGSTWEESINPEFTNIYNIQLINDSTVYFIGRVGFWPRHLEYFYKTFDIFNNLSKSFLVYTIDLPISFFCLDEQTIFANERGKLMKSINGGKTWEGMTTIVRGSKIYFKDKDIGFVLNRHLYKSDDGGRSWKLLKFTFPLSDVYFFDRNRGFTCGLLEPPFHWSLPGDDGDPVFEGETFKTNDAGISWNSNSIGGRGIISYFFLNDDIGYRLSHSYRNNYIEKTSDGGDNWTVVYENNADSTGLGVDDMNFMNENKGWAVGWGRWSEDSSGAAILCTSDGGKNWDMVWKYPNTKVYEYGLTSIYVVNTTVWAVGESGLIVKYTEQDQWQPVTGITDIPLRKVFFSDELHGWITGGYINEQEFQSLLLRTYDGGKNWNEKRFGKYLLNDIYFLSDLQGWVVGCDTIENGVILQSGDGGENWTVQVEGLSASLNAIHYKDGYLWAVGGNGLILKSDITTDIWIDEKNNEVYPTQYTLHQNYPNPFNPSTTIEFTLPKSVFVVLKVYNILGKEVSTIVSKKLNQGNHAYTFDGKNLASGIYYYRIEAGNFVQTRKMIYLK